MGALTGNTLKERRERREARLAAAACVQRIVAGDIGGCIGCERVGSGIGGRAVCVSAVAGAGEEGELGAVVRELVDLAMVELHAHERLARRKEREPAGPEAGVAREGLVGGDPARERRG